MFRPEHNRAFLCEINSMNPAMKQATDLFKPRWISTVLLSFLSILSQDGFTQNRDSTLFFRSAISVTQNGFSFIPSFSLGKPAAILDLAIGNRRLSFEPQFRFALEGKPWSFIFIYRYKVVNRGKFQVSIGGHIPAIIFSSQSVSRNGVVDDAIISHRFLAGELLPVYTISKNISVGLYYLRGHGFQDDAVRDTNFLGLRGNFSNFKLIEPLYLQFIPQLYYLKIDNADGYYVTYTLTLAMKNFPLSISNIINKSIQTELQAKKFDWNVSLVYSFDKNYIRK